MGMGCKHNQEMGSGEQEGECQRGPKEAQTGERLGPWSYLPTFPQGLHRLHNSRCRTLPHSHLLMSDWLFKKGGT